MVPVLTAGPGKWTQVERLPVAGMVGTRMRRPKDPRVQLKLELIRDAMPARDAVVFGDVWGVDGRYTAECVERGCERALLIDTLETPAWLKRRLAHPAIDFCKGDFADAAFMSSVRGTFELGIAYDVLLHQAPLLHTLHLMLEKIERTFLLVQPVLEEQPLPNSAVYLPGNDVDALYPWPAEPEADRVLPVAEVVHNRWLWGLTPSFIRAALAGEGFEIVREEALPPLDNPRWSWRGFVAERRERPAVHWSDHAITPGLHEPDAD
jgi:hypothetical protein